MIKKMTFHKKVNLFVAAMGCILTTTQLFMLLLERETICFNEGCEIVETFTTVPPSTFNLFGLLYFILLFWTLSLSRAPKDFWIKLHSILLLAGLAAEGVLVGFQHYVIDVFCSYCLIILALVVLLNLFRGMRHLITGIAVFSAVLIGFFSLSFTSPLQEEIPVLEEGQFASVVDLEQETAMTFFYSSTCPHCEEVLESLTKLPQCNLSFNPVDIITAPPFEELEAQEYDMQVNRDFLKRFGISEIPVLYVEDESGFRFVRAKRAILETIQAQCYPAEQLAGEQVLSGQISMDSYQAQPLPDFLQPEDDENCSIEVECEDPAEPQQ